MKLNLIILGLLMVASTYWPAHTFTIEDDDLSVVPPAAEAAIRSAEAKDDDLQKCEFVSKSVDLDGDGHATDLIVTIRDAGGWGAALGPIWVLRNHGDSFLVVLSEGGYSVTIGGGNIKDYMILPYWQRVPAGPVKACGDLTGSGTTRLKKK